MYWHSVFLHKDKCTGCTKCMHICPTQAIRVVDGEAQIMPERCIDCGECIRICPVYAKDAKTDPLSELGHFKYNVAITSISFLGQFGYDVDPNRMLNTLLRMGFDNVFSAPRAADVISVYLQEYIENESENIRPLISTACPACTRLIQMKYPSLIDNIIKIESPPEVAARMIRSQAKNELGLDDKDIGIFLIADCPAKVTSIKKPLGISHSQINGAISLKSIYTRMLKIYDAMTKDVVDIKIGNGTGIGWGKVGGQSRAIDIDQYIAVDGIDDVINVLDKVELGMLNHIKYIECYSCTTGCTGGPLNVETPHIAKSRIRVASKVSDTTDSCTLKAELSLDDILWTEEVGPTHAFKLDPDFKIAIQKMSQIEKIEHALPGLDCGACGAPTCRSLAEDIVMNRSQFNQCIVLKGRN